MAKIRWGKFIEATSKRQPIHLLVEAVNMLGEKKENALDLGCGAGIDSKFLATAGFNVTAVDLDRASILQTKKLCASLKIKIVRKNITKYTIPLRAFNLIIAWNSLQFLTRAESKILLKHIQNGLNRGGIFVFALWGPRDEWAKTHKKMSFWTKTDLKKILHKMSFIRIVEDAGPAQFATGGIKFWHKISGIAVRE